MDSAINITTNEIVSAFQMHKDGSYQNLRKGEWIMPQDSVYNYENIGEKDLYIHWVTHKEYRNKRGTHVWVSPHFAKYPGSKAETIQESKEHRALKDWLFTKMKKDDLKFVYSKGSKKHKFENYIKLSELDIDWNKYGIEIYTKGYKALIADILLQFKNKHPLLGKGIFIEIQLSDQSKEETYDRSFSRAIQGYSTAWLFEEDFLIDEEFKNIQLKEDKIKLFSFSSELKYSGKKFVQDLKRTIESQCRYIDEKVKNSGNNINYFTEQGIKKVGEKGEELINKIKNLEDNPFKFLAEEYKKDITTKAREMIKELIIAQEEFNPRVIPCKKCNQGYMVFKITPNKGKELYECQSCKGVIWVK